MVCLSAKSVIETFTLSRTNEVVSAGRYPSAMVHRAAVGLITLRVGVGHAAREVRPGQVGERRVIVPFPADDRLVGEAESVRVVRDREVRPVILRQAAVMAGVDREAR